MRTFLRSARQQALGSSVATVLTLLATGCGIGNPGSGASSPDNVLSAIPGTISGGVHGGQQPIAGSTIQLYEVGSTSYTTGMAKPLIAASHQTSGAAMTDSNGNFNITGDYTCDTGAYVYIAAYGGNPGTGSVNPNIALIAALGPCSVLKANAATTFININEVTTVAAAYALGQFTGGSTFGTPLSSQPGSGSSAPSDNFTTSSTNTQGVANAIAIAQVLASTTTGTSPGSNTNGSATPEWWQVNNVANMISACVNSASPFTNCTTLYSNVNPLGGTTTPADTLQAAIALAQSPTVPAANIANLYGLITAASPFQPYTSSAAGIKDFTLAISYNPVVPGTSTTILNDPFAVSFDQYGNAWVTTLTGTSTDNYVVELDPTGNPIPAGCTSSCTSASNYQIAAYTCGTQCTDGTIQGSGTVVNFEGALSGKPTIGSAVDTINNFWVTDYAQGNVMVVPGSGAVYTSTGTASTSNGGNAAAYGYAVGSGGLTEPEGLAIDGSNDVFVSTVGGSYATTGTGYTNTGYTSGSYAKNYKGVLEFIAGSPSNVTYDALSGGVSQLAISSGTLDKLSGTAISGSPFVWTAGTEVVDQFFSQPTTIASGGQGLMTPLSVIANPITGGYGIAGVNDTGTIATKVPISAGSLFTTNSLGNPSGDTPAGMFPTANLNTIVTDGYGHLWASSIVTTLDSAGDIENALTKVTPNYSAVAPTAYAAAGTYDSDFSFVIYHDEAGMLSAGNSYGGATTTNEPRYLATDGAGDIFFTNNTTLLGAITNSGTPISSSTGFATGTAGAPVGTYFTGAGSSTAYTRTTSANEIQVDQSGNLWLPQQHAPFPSLMIPVGVAVPVSQPASLGLKNGTYGLMP